MQVIKILLGDGHRSFVEALGLRLDAEPTLQVVATVVRPEDAVRAAQVEQLDVAVLAVNSDPAGFLSVGPALHALHPTLRLVGVTSVDDPEVLARAVKGGFRGWLPKDVGIGVLLDVLQAVCRGETSIPPMLLTGLLDRLLRAEDEQRAAALPFTTLTAREQEVLRAMSRGANRQEIAVQLAISPNTVRSHMQSILNKLDVHSSLAAVTLARHAGIQ